MRYAVLLTIGLSLTAPLVSGQQVRLTRSRSTGGAHAPSSRAGSHGTRTLRSRGARVSRRHPAESASRARALWTRPGIDGDEEVRARRRRVRKLPQSLSGQRGGGSGWPRHLRASPRRSDSEQARGASRARNRTRPHDQYRQQRRSGTERTWPARTAAAAKPGVNPGDTCRSSSRTRQRLLPHRRVRRRRAGVAPGRWRGPDTSAKSTTISPSSA